MFFALSKKVGSLFLFARTGENRHLGGFSIIKTTFRKINKNGPILIGTVQLRTVSIYFRMCRNFSGIANSDGKNDSS